MPRAPAHLLLVSPRCFGLRYTSHRTRIRGCLSQARPSWLISHANALAPRPAGWPPWATAEAGRRWRGWTRRKRRSPPSLAPRDTSCVMTHPASDSPQSASHSASETAAERRAERGARPSSRRRRSHPQRLRSVTGAPNSTKPSAKTPTVLMWPSTCEQRADEARLASTNRRLQNASRLELKPQATRSSTIAACRVQSGMALGAAGKTLGIPCAMGVERSAPRT
jgi:hypothetical protein